MLEYSFVWHEVCSLYTHFSGISLCFLDVDPDLAAQLRKFGDVSSAKGKTLQEKPAGYRGVDPLSKEVCQPAIVCGKDSIQETTG